MSNNVTDLMVWIDTETFGLEASDHMLEIGLRVTDSELVEITRKTALLWSPYHKRQFEALDKESWVYKQHTASGLFFDAEVYGESYPETEDDLITWITQVFRQFGCDLSSTPLSGSTVGFDRKVLSRYMPTLYKMFHYRSIDISTLKELCKLRSPELYAKQDLQPKKLHRVQADLGDTILEAGWYFDNFLY